MDFAWDCGLVTRLSVDDFVPISTLITDLGRPPPPPFPHRGTLPNKIHL